MGDNGEQAVFPSAHAPASRQRGRRWLRRWSSALAVMVALVAGAPLGTALGAGHARAAPIVTGGVPMHLLPGAGRALPRQCGGELTVSRVTNRTITVTRADGSTATVHVTAHTQYTRAGQAVAAGAVVAGSRIYVVGSCAGRGRSINATSIEVVG